MHELTTEERFILVALQRSSRGKTSIALTYVTGMQIELVDRALDKLEDLSLVESILTPGSLVYLPVDVGSEPVFAHYADWLLTFRHYLVESTESSLCDSTFASARLVLLVIVLTRSQNQEHLAKLTSTPLAFVSLVFSMAEMQEIWWSDWVLELRDAIIDRPSDFEDILWLLDQLMEEFSNVCWIPELNELMKMSHSGMLLGADSSDEANANYDKVSWVN
jgi:hypothetical protein